jgi:hypothetical protein
VRPRLEQAPHGCCRSHLSLAKLSVHDFVMAIEHVLSVFARVAGKLDFVSASIWRRTRALSIVGHGVTGLRRSRSSTSSGYAQSGIVPWSALKQFHSHFKKRKKLSGGANREAMEKATTVRPSDPPRQPSASTVRAPPTMPVLRTVTRDQRTLGSETVMSQENLWEDLISLICMQGILGTRLNSKRARHFTGSGIHGSIEDEGLYSWDSFPLDRSFVLNSNSVS